MADLVALGELLIDFTESGTSSSGMMLFERNPGGAVANVLAAVSRLGGSTAFLGKVGDDMHGRFLKKTLEDAGIDVTGLLMTPDFFTTLAFVAISGMGERTFSFARKPGADTQLRAAEVNETLVRGAKILHVGSLSLTDEPAHSATLHAIAAAKEAGVVVSYDPNYRASLWKDEKTAKEHMRELLPLVDIIKLSEEETALLTDYEDAESAGKYLNMSGIPCAAVTLGNRGVLVCISGKTAVVDAYPPPAVDTTGAGDAFMGGFLYRMLSIGKRPHTLTLTEAKDCANWGNATAACCVQKRGAIPAMPTLTEVLDLMHEYGADHTY